MDKVGATRWGRVDKVGPRGGATWGPGGWDGCGGPRWAVWGRAGRRRGVQGGWDGCGGRGGVVGASWGRWGVLGSRGAPTGHARWVGWV